MQQALCKHFTTHWLDSGSFYASVVPYTAEGNWAQRGRVSRPTAWHPEKDRGGSLAQADSGVARIHGWWEGKLEQPFWGAIWRDQGEFKIYKPSVLVILLLGIYSSDVLAKVQNDVCAAILCNIFLE